MAEILDGHEPPLRALLETASPALPWSSEKMVRDALARGVYRTQTAVPVPAVLLTDDAAQERAPAQGAPAP